MALTFADRVQETTTTTGTGTISLAGASSGYQSFIAGVGNANTCYYAIQSGSAWEVGVGTVTSGSPNTLSRDTILASSNSGSAITLAGTSNVWCDVPAGVIAGLTGVIGAAPSGAGTGLTSWLNQGGASVADVASGIALSVPAAGASNNLRGRFGAAPTAPYTRRARVGFTGGIMEGISMGVGWYDGSNKSQMIGYEYDGSGVPGVAGIVVISMASPTSFNANHFNGFGKFTNIGPPIWFQIEDDGTNVSFGWGQDGETFTTLYTIAKSSGYLGSGGYSNLLFYGNAYENNAFNPTLMAFG